MSYGRITRLLFLTGIFLSITKLSPLIPVCLAGPYLSSAHGNTSYGVNRNSIAIIGYTKGHCAHCHEQHTSVNGSEPDPVDNASSPYGLFFDNFVSIPEMDSVCLKCHDNTISIQQTAVRNRSYSYRAGGYTADAVDDIKEIFSYAPGFPTMLASSHNLKDIQTFFVTTAPVAWKYNSSSNPCAGCHNPHAVQGDPANAGISVKSSGTRGYLISRPSQHGNSPWGLWGDDNSEKMNPGYTNAYQAPYCYNSTTVYEPDGSNTTDGTNLTDINTFCLDCHQYAVPTSVKKSLHPNYKDQYKLAPIDWETNGDKHGKNNADGSVCLDEPYPAGMGRVLSCLDCHEPHGSRNPFLIRKEVNGAILSDIVDYDGPIQSDHTQNDMRYLCNRCHKDDFQVGGATCYVDHYKIIHHTNTGCNSDAPYILGTCTKCHTNVGGPPPPASCNRNELPCGNYTCVTCHFHGAKKEHLSGDGVPACEAAPPVPDAIALPAGTAIF